MSDFGTRLICNIVLYEIVFCRVIYYGLLYHGLFVAIGIITLLITTIRLISTCPGRFEYISFEDVKLRRNQLQSKYADKIVNYYSLALA